MSKGIAINTILYLLVGILVVGIVVYLVYSYASGEQLSEQECRSRIITWCTGCSVSNWASGSGVLAATNDVATCINDHYATGWDDGAANCNANSAGASTQTFCNTFI